MRAARQGCRALQNVGTVRRAAQVCHPYERAGQFPVVTLIRPLRGHLSLLPLAFGHFPLTGGIGPLEGGRLLGDRKGRPYGGNAPGALVRQSQAPTLNRKCSKFCRLRPPVGPEGIALKHS